MITARVLGIAILLGLTSTAWAVPTLTLYDGVNPLITVVDNGPGDMQPGIGIVGVATNVGVWRVANGTATSKPAAGSATSPEMTLHIVADSTAAGSLRLVFSDNDFGPYSANVPITMIGTVSGANATGSFDLYGDPANVVGATTVHIAGTGTTALPATATGSGILALGAPYSLTEVVEIVASGAGTVDITVSFPTTASTPDGGLTAAMLAMGLALVEGIRRRIC